MPQKPKTSKKGSTFRRYTAKKTFLKNKSSKRKSYYSKNTSIGVFKRYNVSDPFRPFYNCRMTYTTTDVLSVGAVGVFGTEKIFRLNSLYDPDYSGTGHQPYGFDQLAGLYRKYMVNAIKISIVFDDPDQDSLVVAVQLQPSSSSQTLTGSDADAVKERPMAVTRCINNTGSQIVRVNQYMTMSKIEGISPLQWKTQMDQYGALATANPTLTPYIRLAVGNVRSSGSGTIVARTTLTFYTKWWDRIGQAQS